MTSATADCMRIQHKLAYLMTLLNFSWWDTTVHIMQRLMHKFHVGKFFHGEATYVTPLVTAVLQPLRPLRSRCGRYAP